MGCVHISVRACASNVQSEPIAFFTSLRISLFQHEKWVVMKHYYFTQKVLKHEGTLFKIALSLVDKISFFIVGVFAIFPKT